MAEQARRCVPCQAGMPPMTDDEIRLRSASTPDWTVAADGKSMSRRWRFRNFDEAFALVVKVAEIARREDHHPDVAFGWGYATFTLSTHAIGGLHENDFVVAAMIDQAAIDQVAGG